MPVPPGPAQTCGGTCNDGAHDCDASGECSLCMPEPPTSNTTFQCKAGCGRGCTIDTHCGSAGCGKCANGTCTPGGPAPGPVQQCNGPCQVNTDCDAAGECGICVPKTSSSFHCSASCGGACTSDAHCGVANCMKCVGGTCSPQQVPPAPAPPQAPTPSPPAPQPPAPCQCNDYSCCSMPHCCAIAGCGCDGTQCPGQCFSSGNCFTPCTCGTPGCYPALQWLAMRRKGEVTF